MPENVTPVSQNSLADRPLGAVPSVRLAQLSEKSEVRAQEDALAQELRSAVFVKHREHFTARIGTAWQRARVTRINHDDSAK
jgi:hypothetical protein